MKKNVTLLLSTILLASFFASCGLFDPIPKEEKQDNEPHFLTQIEMGGNNIKKGSFKDRIEISNDTVRRTFETIKPATTDELQLKYASLMGCLPKQITNLPLYYLIEEWYGVSYRLGGNTKAGIDCSSFTKMLILEIYKKQLLRTAQEQYQQSTKLYSFDDMTEGDLVFFKSGRRHIGHVGVYLGNHFFVHASTSGGVMISSLHESYWNRRFAGGGRP